MASGVSRKRIWTAVILTGAVVLIVFYALVDPGASPFMPKCLFHTITGMKCPGCGSQRAVHALLNGDIRAAWDYNALIVAGLIPAALYIYAEITRVRHPKLYATLNSLAAVIIVAVVIVAWGVGRNID